METLPKGATLIMERNCTEGRIVLCLWETRYPQFVTWQCSLDNYNTFWGHYFDHTPEGLTAAIKDFNKRGF